MVRYAAAGYAFLFVDIRGNGGQTPGYPFNPSQDYSLFEKGEWPQYYLTVCDLVAAQKVLSGRFNIPVYAIGSSNGGRYAAVATGVDPGFSGYVGDLDVRLGNTRLRYAAGIFRRSDTFCIFPGAQFVLCKNIPTPGLDLPFGKRSCYPV